MAALTPAPHAEALAELIGYLMRAGVEPTRLAIASLATDRGLDNDAVRDLLDRFDRQAAGGAQ
ncbi:hypothetical protein [Bosea sp. (in: a-proteobacteria)]|uniref:hypothetical protein n=1 Tax=Bosea sp. (in: a-proteobacteria) TaxID=1871050 RepID=UPI00086BB369|nr:hypothetical protein [Bosea sp. (in: a-proteobacteria)]MBN9439359.1 hypothetical protein [Bosea sp. (in: a-proteobacteria)]ODT44880.1 MAG: hypothetical protein ABS59_18975 [Methylobacterium sp. SCN 67-24]